MSFGKNIIYLLLAFQVSLSADNLLSDRQFTGWKQTGKREIALDTENKINRASVRLENNSSMRRELELEPDSRYELTFYIKGKDIQSGGNHGARIMVKGGKIWERFTASLGNLPATGTFDWKKGSGIIDTGKFKSSKITVFLSISGTGTVWFDEVKIAKMKDAAKPEKHLDGGLYYQSYSPDIRSAALVPQGVFGFFEPGEEIKFKFEIDGTAKEYEYTLHVKNEYGDPIFKQEKKKLNGVISVPGQPCGYYVTESDLYVNGKKAYTIQGGFAVTPVPGKRDPFFRFGYGVFRELHDGYKRIGCGGIVLKLHWKLDDHDAAFLADRAMKTFQWLLDSGDFQLTASLGTSLPRNAMRSKKELDDGWPLLNDRWLKQYLDFIALIAPRLKIKEWHIGQETPSNAAMKWKFVGTWSEAMSNFVVLARLGSRQLKKIDPEIKIVAGGNNVRAKLRDIEPIQMGDIVKDFDMYSIDAYTGNWDIALGNPTIPEVSLMGFYRETSELSQRLGKGKYIANDETGYSINHGAPFDRGMAVEQARLTARSIIISKAGPVASYQLFCPTRWRAPAKDSDRHMATVWKTVTVGKQNCRIPLPGGAIYATASTQLAFAKSADEIIHENIYSYIFTKPDGSSLVTIWNIEENQPFALKLPSGSKMFNMYGSDITGKPLAIGPDPIYITVRQPPQQVSAMIRKAVYDNSPEFKCAAIPGTVFVRSLVKDAREAEIRFPGRPDEKVKILPDKVNVFKFPVQTSGMLIAGSRQYDIPLEKIPVHELKRISGPEELRRGKPGILKYPEHIRPIEALQPERCHFKSDYNPNGHNVSVRYWTGYDDNNFYLAADVDDPIHIQRYSGLDIWRDDSLQFVLAPRDFLPASMRSKADTAEKSSEYSFGLALTPKGAQLVKYLGKDAGVVKYPAKVTREGGITRYEAAVPWSAAGGKAKRFGFVVFDNNKTANKSAPYWLEYTPGIAGGADSSKLKLIQYQ